MVKKETKTEKVRSGKAVAKKEVIVSSVKETKVAKVAKKEKEPKTVVAEAPIKGKEKRASVKVAKKSKGDTGSVDFQVSNFSEKIVSLSEHLKKHPHDFDSRRGLLIMVGKRRRLLNYLKKSDNENYLKLVASLKLKK